MGIFSDILLTVDYDRTLTAPDSTIPERNLEAIRYFIENGGAFTVNTGRSVPMTRVFRDRVPVNAPLLLYNGSAAYDLEKQEAETQEIISLSQRIQADFENFKKITDKRNKELIKFANENLIKEFIDCYEDFGRALEIENDEDLREGIKLIYNKFKDVLTKEGVEEIPAKGEKFDLNKHEALMVQESEDVENGYIIEELMKGYMYKDKVLKYSKVIVCKK